MLKCFPIGKNDQLFPDQETSKGDSPIARSGNVPDWYNEIMFVLNILQNDDLIAEQRQN